MHILKEPLVGFLFLGAAMFALFQVRQDDTAYEPEPSLEILVRVGDVNSLFQTFEKTWQRPPTPAELDHLIENHVRDEIFYREALAMGLDRDDAVIKRHLRRKLEFMLTDLGEPLRPTDAELQAFLDANDEAYQLPAVYSLRQVWLDSRDSQQAGAILQRLRSGEVDVDSFERWAIIPAGFSEQSTHEIERVMGREFVASLARLPTGEWHGPIRSGLGLHLVHISERADGRVPPLAEVRHAVVRDWSAERRRAMDEALFATFRQRYTITLEQPSERDDADAVALSIASVGTSR